MENLNKIVAKNLIYLRKEHKLTQTELAEKVNYSDKSISKWERGEALPDLSVLKLICELYDVSLDKITSIDLENDKSHGKINPPVQGDRNKLFITLLSASLVWILSTILFVYLKVLFDINYWMIFIWALPVTTVVLIVFNGIFGKRVWTFALVSILVWTFLLSIYLQTLQYNLWPIFIIGVPLQVAIILWGQLKPKKKHHDE